MTEGLLTKVTAGLKQFVASNPSVLTAKSLINQKGGRIAIKTQQSDSLCLAVNPPPFNKGGKCGGAGRGDGCAFEKVVEMERVGATGGARKASDKCSFTKVVETERVDATGGASKARTLCGTRGYCLFAMVVGMERVGATGGASSSPTKSERDSAVLEGLVQAKDGGEAIPPVVARIFSGDSTSPLTREASVMVQARDR